MSEQGLRVVVRTAAEREEKINFARSLRQSTRLAAVALYRRTFGESEFLQQFSARKFRQLNRM